MMISPDVYVEGYRNKSYKELLMVRDELLKEIRAFENHTYSSVFEMIHPSPEVVYQCNLEYLGKLCELIAEKYNQEYVWGDTNDDSYLEVIRDFLEAKGIGYNTALTEEIEKRKTGKKYTIRDHLRGMIYSLLSNQTKWYRIEPHLLEIDKLFYDYDPKMLLAADPEHFCQGLFDMKCGNMNTKAQMKALADNIHTFHRIETEYGSIDSFITSEPADIIVQKLSKATSPYKMKMLGEALAWEYLRNVGIDGAKPDTHLRRFLGADRMGTGLHSPATISEVNEQIASLSEKTGMTKVEVDNLIWSFCADGFGEICTAKPHCDVCPIVEWCCNGT